MLDNDKWRLGHHRPWWQWNVLTLAAALFVLIWSRELFELERGVWPLCVLIFFVWLVIPLAVPEPVRPLNADPFLDDAQTSPDSSSPPASTSSSTTSATND
jgi:hypothetical protein